LQTRLLLAAAVSAAAFAALGVVVDAGGLRHLDQHAASHWMPWLVPDDHGTTIAGLTLPQTTWSLGGSLVDVWTYPAAVLPSALLVLAAALALRRSGRAGAAGAWAGAWLAANAVEVAVKAAVERPTLHSSSGIDLTGLDHSYPSGHALRALVAAAALTAAWRRAAPALVWALSVPVALVVLGDHTPTDVAGGVLLAVSIIAATFFLSEFLGDRKPALRSAADPVRHDGHGGTRSPSPDGAAPDDGRRRRARS
jgi:membrane-associated phospholipid phosphatase